MRNYLFAAAIATATIAATLTAATGADRAEGQAPNVAAPAIDFGSLTTIYIGSGVRDNGGAINTGVATSFHCTNATAVSVQLRFLVLNFDGTTAASTTVTVLSRRTHTASTHGTVAFNEDTFLSTGTLIEQGAISIESTDSGVFCSAMIVDAANAVPVGNPLHLVRVNAHPGTVE